MWSKSFILGTKKPAGVRFDLFLGQLGSVLAENVEVVVQINICQGNVVDGERSPASCPDLDVGTQRIAKEYCSAFSDRAAMMRLRLPTLQSILSL